MKKGGIARGREGEMTCKISAGLLTEWSLEEELLLHLVLAGYDAPGPLLTLLIHQPGGPVT